MGLPVNVLYVSRAPKQIRAEDGWWPETRERMDAIIVDDTPVNTGLVDQRGVPIVRLSSRGPLGFCR